MDKNDLDALKLLGDWSKWLASVQAAIISLMGIAAASGHISLPTHPGWCWAMIAIILFLLSLLSASFLLFSLPGVAQRLPPKPGEDILMMGTFNGGGMKVVFYSMVQFICFGLGASCLAIWAVLQ